MRVSITTLNVCDSPGASVRASAPTFDGSTHTIPIHSSSPMSDSSRARSAHGFQTTVEFEPDLLMTMSRRRTGSWMTQASRVPG